MRSESSGRRGYRALALFMVAAVVIGCDLPAGSSSVPPASPGGATARPGSPSPVGTPPSSPPPSARPSPTGWVSVAPMLNLRQGFDAVPLGDGTVLAVGSDSACVPGGAEPGSETAEVYDPAADTWIDVASLNNPRKVPATVGLADGLAMVNGGYQRGRYRLLEHEGLLARDTDLVGRAAARGGPRPSLRDPAAGRPGARGQRGSNRRESNDQRGYDPAASTWSNAGAWPAGTSVTGIVSLRDGRALAVYRFERHRTLPCGAPLRSFEWRLVHDRFALGCRNVDLVALADGGALLVGGAAILGFDEDVDAGRRVERFDPDSAKWAPASPMATARFPPTGHAAGGRSGAGRGRRDDLGDTRRDAVVYRNLRPTTDGWMPGPTCWSRARKAGPSS